VPKPYLSFPRGFSAKLQDFPGKNYNLGIPASKQNLHDSKAQQIHEANTYHFLTANHKPLYQY